MTREEVDQAIAEEGNRLKAKYEGRSAIELKIIMMTESLNKLKEMMDHESEI